MRRRRSGLLVVLATWAALAQPAGATDKPDIAAARQAAERWFSLVEEGRIDESLVQFEVEGEAIDSDPARFRTFLAILGPVHERLFRKSRAVGKQIELTYDASFEKGTAHETILLGLEVERWIVRSYCARTQQIGPPTPERAAELFLRGYLAQPSATRNFTASKPLLWFMTTKLRRVLLEAETCQADWRRQQVAGSQETAPFTKCCLFSSNPDGPPTSFLVDSSERLADGRFRVPVTFSTESARWNDALVMRREGGDYRVDDFVALWNPADPAMLSQSFEGCRGRSWVGLQ